MIRGFRAWLNLRRWPVRPLSSAHRRAIVEGMTTRPLVRPHRRVRVEWWVLAAWTSLLLVVAAGLLAAAGVGGR